MVVDFTVDGEDDGLVGIGQGLSAGFCNFISKWS